MKFENRKQLRDALVDQKITDVIFHDSHGLIIDILLENGKKMVVCTYDTKRPTDTIVGDFYVSLDEKEL